MVFPPYNAWGVWFCIIVSALSDIDFQILIELPVASYVLDNWESNICTFVKIYIKPSKLNNYNYVRSLEHCPVEENTV